MGWRKTLLALGIVALPRLLVFPFAENVAGDAVVRSWLAHAWLQHPHLIGSSLQGCAQYGPLHFPLIALVEWVTGSEHLAGRLVSLLAGVLSALPIFALARRLFSERAAWSSVVVLALWPLHVQASTTAASEAVSGVFVLVGVAAIARALETREREVLMASAFAFTLGAAVRYDVWLWIPLIAVLLWWQLGFRLAFLFGVVAASFPVAWLLGHLVDTGDLLYPVHVIDDYHRTWFVSESAIWGPTRYRFIVLGFWPLTALATFTPVAALLGARELIRSKARWLVLLIVLPTLVLSLRGALLESFVPLSRFTMKELSLFVIFVGVALSELKRPLLVLMTASLVAWAPLVELAARADWRWANSFRAISGLSLNDPHLREIVHALRERASPTDIVAVDVDPRGFDDIQLAFECGLPFKQVGRRRASSFDTVVAPGARWLVLFDGGVLTPEFAAQKWREVVRSGPGVLLQTAR